LLAKDLVKQKFQVQFFTSFFTM